MRKFAVAAAVAVITAIVAGPALASTTVSAASIKVTGATRFGSSTLNPTLPFTVGRNSACSVVGTNDSNSPPTVGLDFSVATMSVALPRSRFHDGTFKLSQLAGATFWRYSRNTSREWEIVRHHGSASLTLSGDDEMSGRFSATMYPVHLSPPGVTSPLDGKPNLHKPIHVVAHWSCAGDWHDPFPVQPTQ